MQSVAIAYFDAMLYGAAGSFKGCFDEPENCARPGPLSMLASQGDMTIQKCIQMAEDRGLKYAAVQFAVECWGGNDVSKYTSATICTMPCAGNKLQMCGGPCVNGIYATRFEGVCQGLSWVWVWVFARVVSCVCRCCSQYQSASWVMMYVARKQ
jgi:hypothetical protein